MHLLFRGRRFIFPRVMLSVGFPKESRDGLNFAHPSHPSKSILDSPSSEVKHPAGQAALANVCSLAVGLFCRMLKEMVLL